MILLFVLQQADYLNQMQTNQNPARAVLPGVLGCDVSILTSEIVFLYYTFQNIHNIDVCI